MADEPSTQLDLHSLIERGMARTPAQELEVVEPRVLVVPGFRSTGEIVDFENPQQCASILNELKTLKQQIRDLEEALKESLFEESRRQGTKTMHFAGVDAVVTTPSVIAWDYEILCELVHTAGLPEERFDALVQEEISYKVNGSVAKSIASSNEDYAAIIERAQTKVPKTPSVTVKPTKGES